MSGLASAVGSFWAWLTTVFDPLCGPVGLFTLFGQGTVLACGDTGWGDEIALGLKVTIIVAIATLPLGLLMISTRQPPLLGRHWASRRGSSRLSNTSRRRIDSCQAACTRARCWSRVSASKLGTLKPVGPPQRAT